MKNLFLLLTFVCFTFSLSAQKVKYIDTQYGVSMPENYTAKTDVVYKTVEGWEGKMDLYLPPNLGKPTPVIINIHGGGWNHGSKDQQTGFTSFFKKGMAVANIGYRLVDVAPAPAAIEDVRSVLIYLIKNAKILNIDTDKIVIMGGSAGGHLALCGGYIADNPIFDTDRGNLKNIKVAAVINKYGIADMVPFSTGDKAYKSAVRWLGDESGNIEFMKSVSPVTYINKKTPPTFIVHGDADPIVPYSQSVELYNVLKKNGVKIEFMTVKDGGHGKFKDEDKSKLSKAIIDFLIAQNIID
ncbi:acetyl esterase/lipase [Dysgonomonas alginatilytica]|uniref:Acetyl esterase/lipase n=1 Tax=Dysgonomonas alginatilytica TaxID=1605892 RepID=A0A2V3PSP9_9BACT|nr:alpha/beta hydrolase [Dysgonomonas alginatilytica]PXV68747.1 acetyl esterase/lipase [Dysgonomonas alginatilytica]